MLEFMKKELESRQHELKLFQMFIQSQQPSSFDPLQNVHWVQHHKAPSQQSVTTLHPSNASSCSLHVSQLPVGQAVTSESWVQN